MTPQERAAAIHSATGVGPFSFSLNGINFSVQNVQAIDNRVICSGVTAWTGTGSKRVYLPVDNPYIFVNPPLLIPDGGTTIDPTTGLTVATFTRNDLAAAKQILYDAVTNVARRLGWIG